MDELIPEHVEPVEEHRKDRGSLTLSQRPVEGAPCAIKPVLPILVAVEPVLVRPEGPKPSCDNVTSIGMAASTQIVTSGSRKSC